MAASAGSFLMALQVAVAFTAFAGFTAFSTVFSVFAAKLVAHLRSDRHHLQSPTTVPGIPSFPNTVRVNRQRPLQPAALPETFLHVRYRFL